MYSSKTFTLCLRDSMYTVLSANGYIEHHIQKGFMPKLSGTNEHTAQMAHIITSFHNFWHFITFLIKYKSLLGIFILICTLLSYLSVFTLTFIKVDSGILRGDSLSPLTINLGFNTFLRYIADPKLQQFGLKLNSLNPPHWFHFVDDATVITGLQREN